MCVYICSSCTQDQHYIRNINTLYKHYITNSIDVQQQQRVA